MCAAEPGEHERRRAMAGVPPLASPLVVAARAKRVACASEGGVRERSERLVGRVRAVRCWEDTREEILGDCERRSWDHSWEEMGGDLGRSWEILGTCSARAALSLVISA